MESKIEVDLDFLRGAYINRAHGDQRLCDERQSLAKPSALGAIAWQHRPAAELGLGQEPQMVFCMLAVHVLGVLPKHGEFLSLKLKAMSPTLLIIARGAGPASLASSTRRRSSS
ncbi:MAG: hypothetical protein ACRDPO_37900 [Streptosporangiaceae bacterium]